MLTHHHDSMLETKPGTSPVPAEAFSTLHLVPRDLSKQADLSETLRPDLSPTDVKDIRRALILASKLANAAEGVFEPRAALPLGKECFEVGLLLCLAGAGTDVVQAGFLSNSLWGREGRSVLQRCTAISRKFGAKVLQLISSGDKFFVASGESWGDRATRIAAALPSASADQAGLWCAILWSKISDPAFDSEIALDAARNLLHAFRQKAVPELVLEALREELFPDVAAQTVPTGKLRITELEDIRASIVLSSELFGSAIRKWGPNEQMLLAVHEFEVGLTLALAGADKATIIAGLLHDAYEGYTGNTKETAEDVARTRQRIKTQVENTFGPEVSRLVEGVTEPAKSEDANDFARRKNAVLIALRAGDVKLAMVSCAAKISTISAGNKFLWKTKGKIEGWSRGGIDANIAHFEEYLDVYKAQGVPPVLIEQFELELERFRGWSPSVGTAGRAV